VAHERAADAVLAVAVFAAGLAGDEVARHSVAGALLTFLLALPLAWRHRAPVRVFLAISVVAFAQWLVGLPLFADVALLFSLYALAAARSRRSSVGSALFLECGALLAALRWGHSAPATFAGLSGVIVAALALGLYVRARRAHIESLLERAARLEFERDQQAQLAAAAERARISREMHDVVAHSLAVVVSLANGAAAKLERDPGQSREALESIAEVGRQALADTRRLLSVLRDDSDAAARVPQSGIEQIKDLVEHAASTGLAATLTVYGEPAPVAVGPALSAYRIVQEAITNAVKHAAGATAVLVELTWAPGQLEITVTDDGRGQPETAGVPGGGFGLAGMRERAALYGGTAVAGPAPGTGWAVRAMLPVAVRDAP
jgi:signal transduction histidine kinase